jgi:hypothetical protein
MNWLGLQIIFDNLLIEYLQNKWDIDEKSIFTLLVKYVICMHDSTIAFDCQQQNRRKEGLRIILLQYN